MVLEIEINSLKETIEELRESIYNLKSKKHGDKVQGGKKETDNGLTEKILYVEELEQKLEKLLNKQMKTLEKIETLPTERTRAIFRYRLIKGYSYEEIAKRMGVTKTTVKRILDGYVDKF